MSEQTTETPGPVTELPKIERWGEGFSPYDLLQQTMNEIEDIRDLALVVRYNKTSKVDDVYNVVSSTMSMHELLGLLTLGKLMSISSRRMDEDDGEVS